jgi:hypothetical protein
MLCDILTDQTQANKSLLAAGKLWLNEMNALIGNGTLYLALSLHT